MRNMASSNTQNWLVFVLVAGDLVQPRRPIHKRASFNKSFLVVSCFWMIFKLELSYCCADHVHKPCQYPFQTEVDNDRLDFLVHQLIFSANHNNISFTMNSIGFIQDDHRLRERSAHKIVCVDKTIQMIQNRRIIGDDFCLFVFFF